MIITKHAIPRRTVLRGLGTALALPLLDSMVPALSALQNTPARPVRRFGVVYTPNGMMMPNWTPAKDGVDFDFSPTLKPMEPFRDRVIVMSGLSSKPPANSPAGAAAGVHARASTRFMTHVIPKRAQGSEISAATSSDQIAAAEFGKHTQLASLELAIEGRDFAGSCDAGYSCAYTNTISWRSASTPLPMENDPRALFERLFGDGDLDPAARQSRVAADRSILDSVTDRINDLNRRVGPRDRGKLSEYLDALRDIERRIQKAEEQSAQQLPVVDQPPGIPTSYEDHARLMFDLLVLAYQSDLTRVSTFMLARELSGRTYPEIGVADAHHPTSHHKDERELIAKIAKINVYHTTLFSHFVDTLRKTPDGDGSLLDHTMLIYGAGMSDSNRHDPNNLPILLVGGAGGQLKGGRHVKYEGNPPMANLLVTLMDKMDVPVERLGGSTGPLPIDTVSM
jgi:hypothetical protein